MGVVDAMVFPVCVGERLLPWRRCTGGGGGRKRRGFRPPVSFLLVLRSGAGAGPARPYFRPATVSRTLALISAGIGA